MRTVQYKRAMGGKGRVHGEESDSQSGCTLSNENQDWALACSASQAYRNFHASQNW